MSELKAITLDLWDTIVRDDSDEPKRCARGLRSKRDERRYLVWEALERHRPTPQREVELAYDVADSAFNTVWHDQHVTWPIATRLGVVLQGLGRSLPEEELAEVIRKHERMEVEIYPDLLPGCAEALRQLAEEYALAVVSDAIVTPGRLLRELLEVHGVKQYFQAFAFSDEVGRSKPHRAMFAAAAEQLGVPIQQMVHVGDREHNDVRGPHALGMKAVLFTASRDSDRMHTTADAVCESYDKLPQVIQQLTHHGQRPTVSGH